MRVNSLDGIAEALIIVGGINWGLVGFFNYNLVDAVFGFGSTASRVIYALVGLSAVYMIYASLKIGRSVSDRFSHNHHPAHF